MNIDEIISRLKEPHREDYLDYLRALNPLLFIFLIVSLIMQRNLNNGFKS